MPVEHIWYDSCDPVGVHTCYLGVVSGEEMLRACLDVGADPRFDDLRWAVGDWSGCSESKVSAEQVQELCALLKPMAKTNPRVASLVVMRPDMDAMAFTNLYMFLNEELPWFVMGYRTLDEVKNWLAENLSVEVF